MARGKTTEDAVLEPKAGDIEVQATNTTLLETTTAEEEPAPLTAEEKAAADKLWAERIAYFKDFEKKAIRDVLLLHWEKGEFAATVLSEPRKYGNRTAETIAEALTEEGKRPVDADQVRQWHRFYCKYSKDDLERAIQQKLPWGAALRLLTIEDKKVREKLQEEFTAGKIEDLDALKKNVKAINQASRTDAEKTGKKVERRGGLSPSSAFRSVAAYASDMVEQLDKFKTACKEYVDIEDAARQKATNKLRKLAVKELNTLTTKLEAALALSEKLDDAQED